MPAKKTTTEKAVTSKKKTSSGSGHRVLVIVESPSKAKTITKYLSEMNDGNTYRVIASIGHVRDLPKNNKKAIDIEGGFIPHYEVSAGKDKVIDDIKAEAEKADDIYLATDPDREGEAIAWHVAQAVKLKNAKRIAFYEITQSAVQEAIQHPRPIDENLKEAQEARRVLDRLVGYDLSGLIWKKVRYGLSAGRVQSPALRILVEREREIRAFKPEAYYVITAETKLHKHDVTFTCTEELKDQKRAKEIVDTGKKAADKNDWEIISVTNTQAKRAPRPPFTTSTLQQAASSRLGMSPSRTMMLAQKLYEAGHITYMRTDSVNVSKVAISQITKFCEQEYGKEYVEMRTWSSKSKNAQEAHEAIRPTNIGKLSAGANDAEKKIYNLIWNRTTAAFMADAKINRTKIVTNIAESKVKDKTYKAIPDFAANGSQILFDGWLKADPDARGEDVILPETKQGDDIKVTDIISTEKFTEPPSRYSEAGLIKELEKRGIGRPSTYASIISTIEQRGYVEKLNKALKPTDTGEVVSGFLEEHFTNYISDSFTAEMEDKLDNIAEGKATYEKTLRDFYTPFIKDVKSKDGIDKITNLGEADDHHVCPKCGSSMVIKLGKNGKFLSCSRFPDCTGALTLDGKEIATDTPIGNDPETGLPIFIKIGKYGPYVQLGEMSKEKAKKGEKKVKPKMSAVPKDVDPSTVTLDMALTYLTLPRTLGEHPTSGKPIIANVGMFGPYVMHDGDFRSLKKTNNDDPYTITLKRALEILAEEKKVRKGGWSRKKKKEE